MTDAEKAAQEILEIFQASNTGVVYINPLLFEGQSVAEVEEVKKRVRRIIDKHMC